MQARSGDVAAATEGAAIWCNTCGIPYAPTMTHCSHCGAPLAGDTTTAAGVVAPVAAAPALPVARPTDAAPAPVVTAAPQVTLPAALPANTPPGLLGRIRTRQQSMSDDEVDAAAAAIIAQARAEELGSDVAPVPREALDLLQDFLPDPVVQQTLRDRRERDRLWLIAGVVCCVLLLLFALAISRYMSVGLLRR
jgi:hypothetical protein